MEIIISAIMLLEKITRELVPASTHETEKLTRNEGSHDSKIGKLCERERVFSRFTKWCQARFSRLLSKCTGTKLERNGENRTKRDTSTAVGGEKTEKDNCSYDYNREGRECWC